MSVLIKGMEMPKSCYACQLCDDWDFLDPYYCPAADKDFNDGFDQYEDCRPEWCPLMEVEDDEIPQQKDDA